MYELMFISKTPLWQNYLHKISIWHWSMSISHMKIQIWGGWKYLWTNWTFCFPFMNPHMVLQWFLAGKLLVANITNKLFGYPTTRHIWNVFLIIHEMSFIDELGPCALLDLKQLTTFYYINGNKFSLCVC